MTDFEFDPKKIGLVFIDMQRDFLDEGGFGTALGNDVSLLRTSIVPCKALLELGRYLNLPIVHTLECHMPDLSDCPKAKLEHGKPGLRIGDPGPLGRILIRGEFGNLIIPDLAPLDNELVIHKPGKGAFYKTNLRSKLQDSGIEQLVFSGVTTEVCVQTSMREATDRGFKSIVATDATDSYFPEFKAAALKMFVSQGAIVGHAAQSSEILSPLYQAISPKLTGTSEIKPGVHKKSLRVYDDGSEIAILKYEPGAKVPAHIHDGAETIWVLKGSQADESGLYKAGDKVVNEVGKTHRVWSDEGCEILIHWQKPVRFVN